MATSVENIGKFTKGAVVLNRIYRTKSCKIVEMYGHVAGFSLNCFEEVTIFVNWADGESSAVHPVAIHLV